MTGSLIARAQLGEEQRRRMLEILRAHFCDITEARFQRDLDEKNWVILIRDETGALVGFSTLLLYQAEFDGAPIAVVYSGDTIIERTAWGSAALPRTWIESVWQLHQAQCPQLPLYWLLLTSGFRTYRFLSVFWREFYPSCRRPTPPRMARLVEQLARERFGEAFDPAAGVAHLGQPLCAALLAIPEAKLQEPHVAFFAERNPGYVRGDELICIAELTRGNLTAAGWRMAGGQRGEGRRM
jgi:hypothetical protein